MGKLSIILAFLLSIAAAGGSYYLYQGWVEARTVRGVVEAKYDQVKEKMITVQSEKEKVAAENAQLSASNEDYKNKTSAMQAQVKKLQDEQSKVSSEKTDLEKKLSDEKKKIEDLQAKMVELEQKAKDAQAACGVTPADLTTNPLAVAPTATSTSVSGQEASPMTPLVFKPVTSSTTSTVSGNAASTSAATSKPEVKFVSSVPKAPEEPATGRAEAANALSVLEKASGPKVLTVNRKFNFVVINMGLQDGLKMGDRLKVLKEGKQIATVQIEKLYDKFSAATLAEENPKQQVVEGDEISRA